MELHYDVDTAFKLKKPCANCPFKKEGAIELRPGRVESIIEDLLRDDRELFPCHKTVEVNEELEDEHGEELLKGTGNVCAGSLAYLIKAGRIPVGMRLLDRLGSINIEDWEKIGHLVLDPDPATGLPVQASPTDEPVCRVKRQAR